MSTRLNSKDGSNKPFANIRRVENSWIVVGKHSLFENETFKIVTLPHPANGKPTKYCLDDSNKKIYEIVTFSEPYRSWFIGETVKSDGSFQMLTPINPLFIVLPRLRAHCKTRAVPLEDLLSEKGFDNIIKFVHNLNLIADMKGPTELNAYKYNEDKTMTWLQERVKKVAKVLRERDIHVTAGATSATFVASNLNNEQIDEELYLKYAHGLISEYLEEDMADTLETLFEFKPETIESLGKKRKSENKESNDTKKIKCEQNEDLNNDTESKENIKLFDVKKQKSLTAKEKARQKAASGTKAISSFFIKK